MSSTKNQDIEINFEGFISKIKSIDSPKIEDEKINYIQVYIQNVSNNGNTIDYAGLTNEIFSFSDNLINELDYIHGGRDFINGEVTSNPSKYPDFPQVAFGKVIRHISLAIIQKNFILQNAEKSQAMLKNVEKQVDDADKKLKNVEKALIDAEKTLNTTKNTLSETDRKVKELSKISDSTKIEVEKMEKIKGTIYTEFIAILGIFSALIFGLFGGFQGLAQAITDLVYQENIGFLLVASSAVTMCLTLLIFGLLQWVARISGRRLVSCDCLSENKCECKHSLFERHKTLFSIFLPLLVCFFVGLYLLFIEHLINTEVLKDSWITGKIVTNIVLYGFPIIVVVAIIKTINDVVKK